MRDVISSDLFFLLLSGWAGLAVVIFIILFFIPAPYGRHWKKGWGPQVSSRTGWFCMEMVSLLGMGVLFLSGNRTGNPVALVFLAMWTMHYTYRAVLFPLTRKYTKTTMPGLIMLFGMLFNCCNAFFNGYDLFHLAAPLPAAWFADFRFVSGTMVFAGGFAIHAQADHILNKLKNTGHTGYRIPYGGLFRWVSCPNYLGEIIQWSGWALATWSPAAVCFMLWTIANLAPRAVFHHKWYHGTFSDYPRRRKALIPFIL
jgi:3-oxo-5-alpha-steroid 4-dehydrogenase 1